MILINLLPHREVARKLRRDQFNVTLAGSVVLGCLIGGLVFLWYQSQITGQQDRNQLLQSEIRQFDAQIKDIAGLEGEIAALRARQQAVEDLQADRNLPVHLLTELVKQLPDGTYIASMRQENQSVTLQGVAQSNERVSELLRNLANNTPWFSKPELVEIVAGSVSLTTRDVRRVANFTIRVTLVRASEAEKNKAATVVSGSTVKQ
ncbi:PilN domain-containing protein [Rhodoferax sp. PAMC 29310]|uniref:PilN domain-containing protein n=1 Tax=Rhodoferax sp. PAMC 29310 TaxID=2822760 RepID=UPI001B3354A7|nr:PilN domain-containing protein [Rhodoferax sp. PAMC 29310]